MTTPSTSPTPRDDTLSDEVFLEDTSTTEQPPTAGGAASSPSAGSTGATPQTETSSTTTATATTAGTGAGSQPAQSQPTYLRGPAPFAVVLGLLGLVIAGATLVTELADLTVPWTDLGPWSVVAAGLVVLLVGAIGLRGSRTRD